MLGRHWVFELPWDVIDDVASLENVPKNLLAAIVFVESGGNPFACRFEKDYKYLFETKKNALDNRITETTEMMLQMTSWGLCQLMGAVAREYGLKGSILQLLEPKINLTYASKLIKRLATRFKERDDIIAAYNAGTPVKSLDGKYKNQAYVDKVNNAIQIIQDMHGGK